MKLFRTEIMLSTAAYVVAETADAALQILNGVHGFMAPGARFDAGDFPDLSLSPLTTIFIQDRQGLPLTPEDLMEVE